MKIFIDFKFTEKPWGGGNQFLKALYHYFKDDGYIEDKIENADIILFNSHHDAKEIFYHKFKFPDKIFVHRVDGPMTLYNKSKDKRDNIVKFINSSIADATIFQSSWSKNENKKLNIINTEMRTVIMNAPNPKYFFKKNKFKKRNGKIKIISTSWSKNILKGFEVYKFIDNNLDFNSYQMTFVGNSPFQFDNIMLKKPLNSRELGIELRENDIFLTASQNDPCSNSLIEAMHSGLVAVALNSGGHPEIIEKGGGYLFNGINDVLEKIQEASTNIEAIQSYNSLPNMEIVSSGYLKYFRDLKDNFKNEKNNLKKISFLRYILGKVKL